MPVVTICPQKDVPRGHGKGFHINGHHVAVFHTDEGWFATGNICSHEHEHLSDGWLEGKVIECPRHGAQFDLKSGEALSLPATEPIPVYELHLEGDDVLVHLPDEQPLPAGTGLVP